jgi:hypothetical protein
MGILTKSDYEKILNYYNIPFSSSESSKQIKNKAEEILAEKLCKCIKKVKEGSDSNNVSTHAAVDTDTDESRAIGICNDTVFRRKGIKHSAFTCKKKPRLLRFHGKKYSLVKRSKYLSKKQKLRRMSLTMKK